MDAIEWLSQIFTRNTKIKNIKLRNLDNPGWWIVIEDDDFENLSEVKLLIDDDKGDNDWIICNRKEKVFDGAGDALKLYEIIKVYKQTTNTRDLTKLGSYEENFSNWLEHWYLNNCDGDWEHSYGVNILTTEERKWNIKIDLGWEEEFDLQKNICYPGIKYNIDNELGIFKAICKSDLLCETLEMFKKTLKNKT